MRNLASHSFTNRDRKQSGGVTFLEHYAGRRLYIREHQLNKYIAVYGGRLPPKRSCFTMFIEDEGDGQKSATLDNLSRDDNCFLDDLSNSHDLVNVAVKFARQRHNVILLRLVDNSRIECPEYVSLSNLSLVTTGFTWYQSCIPGLMPENLVNRELFKHWQMRVNNVSWDALWDYLSKHDVAPPPDGFDTSRIDTASPGSAKTVLNRLKQSKRGCSFFSKHMDQINAGFNIDTLPKEPLHGWLWIVYFTNPLPTATTRKQKRTTNRGKTRKSKSSAPV